MAWKTLRVSPQPLGTYLWLFRTLSSDGYQRAASAIESRIRAEVTAEYAARRERATAFWQRFHVRRELKREIKRRVNAKALPYALY